MKENIKVKAVSLNDFNSLFIVIILDKHGKYNKEKTTKEIAVGIEKLPATLISQLKYIEI